MALTLAEVEAIALQNQIDIATNAAAIAANAAAITALTTRVDAAEPQIATQQAWTSDREAHAAYVAGGWRLDVPLTHHKYVKIGEVTAAGQTWLDSNGYLISASQGLYVVPIANVQSYKNVGFVSYSVLSNALGRQTQEWPSSPPDMAEDLRIELAKAVFGV